jgi:predicted  nucleic acid-binding Zn-ribbon protein
MVNKEKIKGTDDEMIDTGSEKTTLSHNLREEVLTEIIKVIMKKDKACVSLNCLRNCKRCNS